MLAIMTAPSAPELDPFRPIAEEPDPGTPQTNAQMLIALLQGQFPEVVTEDGVDLDILRELLGEKAIDPASEKFGLFWPGRAEARRLATAPATGTLLPKPNQSVDWETTKNIVIEGDNLEVLKLLRRAYAGAVDVIYIDPPYNKDKDFVYSDRFTDSKSAYEIYTNQRDESGKLQENTETFGKRHSKWLTMLAPRLRVAQTILKNEGLIFVSIDDIEVAHLRMLMDSIFGPNNFVENYIWESTFRPDNSSTIERENSQHILCYAKNKKSLKRLFGSLQGSTGLPSLTKNSMAPSTLTLQPEWVDFALPDGSYGPGDMGSGYTLPSVVTIKDGIATKPFELTGRMIWSQGYLEDQVTKGTRIVIKGESFVPYSKKVETAALPPSSLLPRSEVGDVLAGNAEIKELFGSAIFNHPKPTSLIKYLVNSVVADRPNALILDFFAGSGSTGHAVMNLNMVDGGHRHYILVQLDEPFPGDDYGTIADVTRERLRRAGTKMKEAGAIEASSVDFGFRAYKLASSNLKAWDGSADDLAGSISASVNNLKVDRTTDDLLVEMMLRLGIPLTTNVEQKMVAKSPLYNLGNGALFAYFGDDIDLNVAKDVATAIHVWQVEQGPAAEVSVVVRDTGFKNSEAKLNLAETLKQFGIKELRSI